MAFTGNMRELFPYKPGVLRTQLKATEDTSHYITRPQHAQEVVSVIRDIARRYDISTHEIVDGTACLGGDTLSFLQYFDRVTAVEKDARTYGMLTYNMAVYGYLGTAQLCVAHDDIVACWPWFTSEIVYMDPPWGGSRYKYRDEVELSLSGRPLAALVSDMLAAGRVRFVALKVPNNFAMGKFMHVLDRHGLPVRVDVHDVGKSKRNHREPAFRLVTVVRGER